MEITTLDSTRIIEHEEALFKAIRVAPSAAVIMMDSDGLVIFWNKGAENIFGWTAEEIQGRNLHDTIAPERYRSAHVEAFPHFLRTGQGGATGKTLDLTGLHRDGHEVHIQLSLTAIRREGGWGAVAIIHDITERMEMENDLMLERVQLISLFDGMIDPAYVIDPASFKILYMNERAIEYWGSGVGKKCYEVIHNLDKPCSFCNSDQLLGENLGASHVRERKNMVTGHWFRCVDRGIKLADGSELRLEIAVNITEKKEEELALARALDEAQQASQAKSHFMANVSHELRTPLNGIIGMLQLLDDSELTDEQKDFVRTAGASSDGLLKLVEGLLDFSALETGTMALELDTFSPRSVLNKAVDQLHTLAEEKSLVFNVTVDPDVPFLVRGYSSRLRKIIRNIVDNAVKFTDQGSVNIGLALERESAEEVVLSCTVADTGKGIDKEKLGEIFKLFNQADSSHTRACGGLGLGLTLARRLVATMSGRITVESDGPGRGATFRFTFKTETAS